MLSVKGAVNTIGARQGGPSITSRGLYAVPTCCTQQVLDFCIVPAPGKARSIRRNALRLSNTSVVALGNCTMETRR